MLMAANKSGALILQNQYSEKKLWYLEVIAVHPALQSRGLGGGVMRWIMESVGDQPIYLECTARGNVPFYEAFGFRVVEEVELIDDDDVEKLVYWVMVRA
ncbi:Acyl-CoA N-acyltransferase [Penicillium maclennaniae]|uniref:Acyl-CoA N-acyltransferase n=1 Tax=Penicillium maclennaniae TaxID=1343394 RepID=UPI0025412726|nr:Acyl-CoA N-acyltransferase [Penicillium maclennaniae]KAJ5681855.1 Acyl-CoA N-acyltransferase [Penicillium maclennaniae]